MSTRRSFKGIAAIAALALGVLGFTAVPAHATGTPVNLIAAATSVTSAGTVATQIAGPGNSVAISNTAVVGPSAVPVYFTVSGGTTSIGTTSGTLAVGGIVFISTPTVGTITVTGYPITSGAAATIASDIIVITVVTSIPGTVYDHSLIYAAPSTNLPTAATDATFSVTSVSGASNVANFTVSEVDAAGIPILAAHAVPITVFATNALISSPNLGAAPSAATTYLTGNPINSTTDYVLSGLPGFGGTATVTITINNVLVKTYSVKFTGRAVTLKLMAINSVVGIGNATAILPNVFVPAGITANVNALEVQEYDALGNLVAVSPSQISVTSSAPAIAATGVLDSTNNYPLGNIPGGIPSSTSALGVSINGVNVGTATFVATDTSLGLTSPPVTIRVSSGVPTSVVISASAQTYAPGALGTLTTTISDASGPLPAGTYVVLTGQALASIALASGQAQLPGVAASSNGPPVQKIGQITVGSNGTYVDSFNAPVNPGPVTITATPVSTSIVVAPASFTVSGGSSGGGTTTGTDAATDAQTESSDSAAALSDATSAATASGDAADKPGVTATALAVAAQTQLTSLPALVTSVLNKAAALAKSIAAINKKIGKK